MKNRTIIPFCGIRYNPEKVDIARVTAPPYDVISEGDQKALYEKSPYNVVRLILGNQFGTDTDRDSRYTRAASDFQKWLNEGILVRDPEPSLYLYEQQFQATRTRRGFLALRRLEEFGTRIHPHEKTLSGPKADRLLLMKACGANLSPIFSLYSDPQRRISTGLAPHFGQEPLLDFSDGEGVRHRFWRVIDPDLFQEMDQVLAEKNLFIADGHHRYETALAYRDWMRSQHRETDDEASFNYVMMFFAEMSDPGLVILPTHRVLQNWPDFDPKGFKSNLRATFHLQSFGEDRREGFLSNLGIGLMLPGDSKLYRLHPKGAVLGEGVETEILHQRILRDLLHLGEEDEKNPDYLKFVKERDLAMEALQEPQTNCVFLLNPPPIEVLQRVVESGKILPPKTTFFYPKLLTGLVLNQVDPGRRIKA